MKTPDLYKSTGGNPKIIVLVDADVWLELFINRSGFVEEAEKLQQLLVDPKNSPWIEVYTTSKCLRRIRLELGESDSDLGEKAVSYVETMGVKLIPIDENLREKARTSSLLRDFDSAEEVACANAMNLDAIITLNPQNFDGANLPIWSVSEVLKRVQLQQVYAGASLIENFRKINKVALLIGVSEYENYKPLSAPPKDIEAMEKMLRLGGFNTVEKLLQSDAEEITTRIQYFLTTVQEDNLIVLYFSGHGDIDINNNLYLMARDSNKEDETIKNAIATTDINEMMNSCKCRQQILIIDSCFSGAIQNTLVAKSAITLEELAQKSNEIKDRLKQILQAEGRCIFTSSSMNEESFEDINTGLSIFTHYIVEAIKSGEADLNDDGLITMRELYEYIKAKLSAKIKQFNTNMTPQIIAMGKGLEIPISQVNYLPEAYHELDKLLKAGNWEQADEETFMIILKIANKDKGYLGSKDIKKFTSEEIDTIDTIDKLWLKHSNGHFGFTVQKRIWNDLKSQHRQINRTIFLQEFGKHVGWYKNNDWLEYDNFNFTLYATEGHLPSLRQRNYPTGWLQEWEKRFQGLLFPEETR